MLLTERVVAKLLHTRLLMVQPSGLVAAVQIEKAASPPTPLPKRGEEGNMLCW